jgi:hypothetical protein
MANSSSWFDAVLAVYTGSVVTNLSVVTNHHGGFSLSTVVFQAVLNTTYRIAVAGYNGVGGDFSLSWKQPAAPLFTKQPQTTNVVAGENVTFSSTAIGTPQPVYQWRLEGTNLPNATNASYVITNVQTNHMTNYTVVVTNSMGSATSSIAALYVHATGTAKLSDWQATSAQFIMTISGVTNRPYVVEATTNATSTNFIGWLPIYTNYVTFNFTNQITTNYPHRLFRAVYQ